MTIVEIPENNITLILENEKSVNLVLGNPQSFELITGIIAGPEGQSAYKAWLNLGNTGTMQDFIESLSVIQTITGIDGREVELQKSDTHIQWRYVGGEVWIDLILLSDLQVGSASESDNESFSIAMAVALG